MARHVWSVLCHHGVLDKYTGQFSLLQVIEQMEIRAAASGTSLEALDQMRKDGVSPAIPISLNVVSLFVRDSIETPEMASARLRVVGPNGEENGGADIAIDLREFERTRFRMDMPAFVYSGIGTYWFFVEMKGERDEWRLVAEIPLYLKPKPVLEDAATR